MDHSERYHHFCSFNYELGLAIICILHVLLSSYFDSRSIQITVDSTVSIILGLISHENSTSLQYTMSIWGMNFAHKYSDSLWHVDSPLFPKYQRVKTIVSINHARYTPVGSFIGYHSKSIDMIHRFAALVHHFLHESDKPWLYRGTDDILINQKNLHLYLEHLNEHYEPTKQSLIFGHCVTETGPNWDNFFLNGGAGYILSRHLAERINFQELIETMRKDDDVHTTLYLVRHFRSAIRASPAFIGFGLVNGNEACPLHNPTFPKYCGDFIGQANRIVFFHDAPERASELLELYRSIPEMKDDVNFYPKWRSTICIPSTITG